MHQRGRGVVDRLGVWPCEVQIAFGLYAGECGIAESLDGGVIPAVLVRTEAGRTRRARTTDLVPAPGAASSEG